MEKVNVIKEEPCQIEFRVEIPVDVLKREKELVFLEISKEAQLPGFRKGKVPLEIVRKNFSKTASEKVLTNLIEKTVERVIKEKNLKLITSPKVEEIDFDLDKKCSFKLTVERRPVFDIKDYKKIKLKKHIKKITDEDINKSLEELKEKFAKLVESNSKIVQREHFILLDYSKKENGKEVWYKNQLINLKDETLPEGFINGIIGMNIGDTKTIMMEKQELKAKISGIKEKRYPALDDEFAKDAGYKNLTELKDRIKSILEIQHSNRIRKELENQIIDELVKSNPIPVPKSLVSERLEMLLNEAREYFIKNKIPEEEWKKSEPALREKYYVEAEKMVRVSYILSQISHKENIEVKDEELSVKIEEFSKGKNLEIKDYWQKNKEYLSLKLKEDKLFTFLIENAKIKEEAIK